MQRVSVTLTNPTTKESHVYEGVALKQLIPGTSSGSPGGTIEIQFGSHQTTKISGADLDSQSEPMVIDTVDGKQLSGYAPYDFVVKLRGKPTETIAGVQCIAVAPS
jgi:hypothetical protein